LLSNASPTIRFCSCFHCFKFAANCRPRRARCTILMSPHKTRSRGCSHCIMLRGRNLSTYWHKCSLPLRLCPYPCPCPCPCPCPRACPCPACPGPSHQLPSSSFDDAWTTSTWKNKNTRPWRWRKSFLLAWLETHEHRQDPGENGRRIEHFIIGENEHLY